MSNAEPATGTTRSLVERVFREEAGRLTASLVRLFGDFDLAEEMVSEAVVEALNLWPQQGPPQRPGAWLLTTARNRAIDRIRRERRYQDKIQEIAALPSVIEREPDDRLRLIFTCCHPALDPDAQVTLTLRAVAGLTTAEIARAFLVPEATLAKRLTRAKQKIVAAAIPYRTPGSQELRDRLPRVLRVIYLVFNEGYFTSAGDVGIRRELVDDAEWLASLLVRMLPGEPEPLALLALIRLHAVRWRSRLDSSGQLVPLAEQDRSLWDQQGVRSAVGLIERAAAIGRLGPYQIEAAITALHCETPSWEGTDWPQLLTLYDMLLALAPSPVVELNRAVVVGHTDGPAAALAQVDSLSERLARYHLFHATRAALLRELGRTAEATAADTEALRHTANPAERSLLAARLEAEAEIG